MSSPLTDIVGAARVGHRSLPVDSLLSSIGGRFAAGTATDDSQTPGEIQMVLAGYRADGSADAGFGQNGRINTTVYSRINTPLGLAERPGNRDIVVGLNVLDDLGDSRSLIAFAQYGRSGRQRHAGVFVDPPAAAGVTRMSSGTSLIFDMGRIVSSGLRVWSETTPDMDMILARQRATDSLFAGQLRGATSD